MTERGDGFTLRDQYIRNDLFTPNNKPVAVEKMLTEASRLVKRQSDGKKNQYVDFILNNRPHSID